MKLHNVIGGLEKKKLGKENNFPVGHDIAMENAVHNQLCNREVVYNDTLVNYHIGTILSYLSEKYKIQMTEKDTRLVSKQVENISKAIAKGKVLKLTK